MVPVWSGDRLLRDREHPQTPDSHGSGYLMAKRVRISMLAMLKMVTHAYRGGDLEVMGLVQGKLLQDEFVIFDAFALPVQGTETRVNAGEDANEYMVAYQETSEEFGRTEEIRGWYHSHPGYGCWLSGVDVDTQLLYQTHQDPFVAIVIDPIRTAATGRVEIGAFRCHPHNHPPSHPPPPINNTPNTGIPDSKFQDFGSQAHKYYSLEVETFSTVADQTALRWLWQQQWAQQLSCQELEGLRHAMGAVARSCAQLAQTPPETVLLTSISKTPRAWGDGDGAQLEELAALAHAAEVDLRINQLRRTVKRLLFSGKLPRTAADRPSCSTANVAKWMDVT